MVWHKNSIFFGCILKCYFPYQGINPNKRHPALVLQKLKDKNDPTKLYLMVAGGASVIDDWGQIKPFKGSYLKINKTDKSFKNTMLGNDTYFQFTYETISILPFNSDYFFVNNDIGKIIVTDEPYKSRINDLIESIKLKDLIAKIKNVNILSDELIET